MTVSLIFVNTLFKPDDFLNILGVQDSDRVVVPVYSDPEGPLAWTGQTMRVRKLRGEKICELTPDEWWIALNPHEEIGKEFSPWEVKELKIGGSDAIPTLLQDSFQDEVLQPISVEAVKDGEYPELLSSLTREAESRKDIAALYVLRERSEDLEGQERSSILLGIVTRTKDPERMREQKALFQSVAEKALIGGEGLKTFIGYNSNSSVELSIFRKAKATYELESGFMSSLKNLFRS